MMFQDIWETNYQNNRAMNKYPWDQVVSFIFNYKPQNLPNSEIKVLELGFGSGCNLWFCAREGFDSYGVEGSKTAYENAKNWFKRENLEVKLENGLFSPLSYQDEFFDIIIDRGSLTCVETQDCFRSIQEVSRVLKKDGVFLFTPYSKAHQSYIEGHKLKNGLVQVVSGTMMNVGDINFYDTQDIDDLLNKTTLNIEKILHIQKLDMTEKMNHAEWQIILRKA